MSGIAGLGVHSLSSVNLQSMDIETALMMVQSQRSQLLEEQLRSQMDAVNDSNKKMAQLHEGVSGKNQEISAKEAENVELAARIGELTDLKDRLAASKCPDPEGYYGLSWGQGDDGDLSYRTLQQVKDAGLTVQPAGHPDAPVNIDGNHTMDAKGRVVQGWVDELAGKIAELEAKVQANKTAVSDLKNEVAELRGQIDSLSNSQQMEMLRLQSLSNKRNEAFDVMTNFIKKMQDNRSSIIGNMR